MGADYVLTGSVNQACVEAGTSTIAKAMLQEASFSDVSSGPAPDMFEIGAKVQVLSRGSMYAQRAQRLYDLYKRYDSIEAIPKADLAKIEKQLFKRDLDEVWQGTRDCGWGETRPGGARRNRFPLYDGSYFSLVFGHDVSMGADWRTRSKARLSGLVRSVDGWI